MSDSSAPAPGTGGPRSAGTRRAILGAARTTFAARGYEQTTIRAVAARAGVDASMVMRYFGSKAGLFTAAATAELQVPDLRAVPDGERGELLVRVFVDRWEDAARDDELILLLRTAVTSEAVAAQLLGLALCRYILRPLEPLVSLPAGDILCRGAHRLISYPGAGLRQPFCKKLGERRRSGKPISQARFVDGFP